MNQEDSTKEMLRAFKSRHFRWNCSEKGLWTKVCRETSKCSENNSSKQRRCDCSKNKLLKMLKRKWTNKKLIVRHSWVQRKLTARHSYRSSKNTVKLSSTSNNNISRNNWTKNKLTSTSSKCISPNFPSRIHQWRKWMISLLGTRKLSREKCWLHQTTSWRFRRNAMSQINRH